MTIDRTNPIFTLQWLAVPTVFFWVNISNAVHPTINLIRIIGL